MKFAEELFPKGTFPEQKTDGAYIDETLAKNLDIYAKKIGDDMTFLGLISGHDMVGDGKSTLMTQVGTYLTWKINQIHGTTNTFTDENICMESRSLQETSFKLPPLSVICLDEGDDVTTHGSKELALRLKRYFRKCRQLNQIVLLILPSFFEFPKFYALNRSHFLIDVHFAGEFERGYFNFYSPQQKKLLYLRGKKEWDYNQAKPDFHGRFFSSYTFFPDPKGCAERYRAKKRKDMEDDSIMNLKDMRPEEIVRKRTEELIMKIYNNAKGKLTLKDLSDWGEIGYSTIKEWKAKEKQGQVSVLEPLVVRNIVSYSKKDKVDDELVASPNN